MRLRDHRVAVDSERRRVIYMEIIHWWRGRLSAADRYA
jgi:hypothetical protein